MKSSPRTIHQVLGLVLLCSTFGCNNGTAGEAADKKPERPKSSQGLVRLTEEEIKTGDIVVRPVQRGDFTMYRDFPATVVPDHHATADITPLVRGRVVDVYADLGQQIKAGDLLAILYSSELGMAQSSYPKAVAKLYVAERAYEASSKAVTTFDQVTQDAINTIH